MLQLSTPNKITRVLFPYRPVPSKIRISSPTIHKFNQDIYIYEEDNFTISICLAYGRWTSEKRTLFLYDKCLQNNVDDPTLFLS